MSQAANAEAGVAMGTPPAAWHEVDFHREADGNWSLDGVSGIPAALAAAVVQWGRETRLALFGKCVACKSHDFGPGVGVRVVLVCEKWAGVWLPGDAAPWDVQGVALGTVGAVVG